MTTIGKLEIGAIFGRDFRVVNILRTGGMGAVYVVQQLSTGKQRALKVMAPELVSDPTLRERFVLEARVASHIESDHVVEVVTAGIEETSGAPFLVMELLRGETLAEAVERIGPLPLGDVAEILAQAGHGLEQAHARGIVHRDLKPENLFLAVSRRRDTLFTVKILDFGIAKLVEDSKKSGTQPLGTPLFMAPEQTDRKGAITPKTDVWALGLIVFYALTGKYFWADAESGSLPTLLREIVLDPIPTASERAKVFGVEGTLPMGFDSWFSRCVQRNSQTRFADAGAAVSAFVELVPPNTPRGTLRVQTEQGVFSNTGEPTARVQEPAGPHEPFAHKQADIAYAETFATDPFAPPPLKAQPPTITASASAASLHSLPEVPKQSAKWALGAGLAGVISLALAVGFLALKARPNSQAVSVAIEKPNGSVISVAPPAASVAAAPCPEGMVLIEGGFMFMGAKGEEETAMPVHRVKLARFCLDKHEVTAGQYQQCVNTSSCVRLPQDVRYPHIASVDRERLRVLCTTRREGQENHPMNCIDWASAATFCKMENGRLPLGGARLPTEAEWEYAARGSSQRTYPWGDDPPSAKRLNACGLECVKAHIEKHTMYNEDDGFFATAPVGSFPDGASTAGVMDLAGNVWEWTSDWYAPYTEQVAENPKGPSTGEERVIRGGGFNGYDSAWAKPSYRYKTDPDVFNHAIGFRCATDVHP